MALADQKAGHTHGFSNPMFYANAGAFYDVTSVVAFYTQQLGFKLDQQNLPAFAQVSIGNLKLILSGPGAFRFPPNARRPHPGARQMESAGPSSSGPPRPDRGAQENGPAF